jgi:hypothetical protein
LRAWWRQLELDHEGSKCSRKREPKDGEKITPLLHHYLKRLRVLLRLSTRPLLRVWWSPAKQQKEGGEGGCGSKNNPGRHKAHNDTKKAW